MTIFNIQSVRKKEKGVALIFTLIMLSLLMILALSFAMDSMFIQKAAYNSANSSASALLTQTQLKQVLSLIENEEDNYDNSRLYSVDSSIHDYAYTDMLKERLPVSDVLELTDYTLKDSTPKVKWNYITDGSDGKIIGRTAFVVIPDNNIPLDSLVDERVGTTAYPKHDDQYYTETRIGKYVSEINIRDAIPVAVANLGGVNDTKVNSMTEIMSLQGTTASSILAGFDNGEYTGSWSSFENLFSTIDSAAGFSLLNDPEKIDFKNNLSLTVTKDQEAFWADINSDTVTDSTEFYNRFDLTRDWDTADNAADLTFIKEKILLDSNGDGIPDQDMEIWDSNDSDTDSAGLPWLACFGYNDDGSGAGIADESLKGSFALVRDRRYQIAANLKDYCDDDKDSGGNSIHRPTSDIDPANWTTTEPTFTGNERTPYINKIGFKVTASQGQAKVGGKYDVWANIGISPTVELINIYGTNWTETLTVYITGTVNIETTINGVVDGTSDASLDCSIAIDSTDWAGTAYSNFISEDLSLVEFNEEKGVKKKDREIQVKVTGFSITKVVLHNGTLAYDYTKTLSETFAAPFTLFIGDSDTIPDETSAWFGFAVHDPRQNLHAADWQYLTPLAATDSAVTDPTQVFSLVSSTAYEGKPNAENSTYGGGDNAEAPNIGGSSVDIETVTDPANISTAFIRNAPMESPWELGFIHRGIRWQTINLKIYDVDKAFQVVGIDNGTDTKNYIPGGGLYSDGDANILDQIKMTASAESPQKINLKSSDARYLDPLFTKIKLGCTIDDTTMSVSSMAGITPLTGSELTSTEITDLGDAVNSKYKTDPADEIRTRASVVDQLSLGSVSDALGEELIGKLVNLTKITGVCGDRFTVIVLAQTIKDVGGTSVNPISISKYSDNEVLQTKADCEIGKFDAHIDSSGDSKDNVYFDEITAEQKIQVECVRNTNGTITITSFQYID